MLRGLCLVTLYMITRVLGAAIPPLLAVHMCSMIRMRPSDATVSRYIPLHVIIHEPWNFGDCVCVERPIGRYIYIHIH